MPFLDPKAAGRKGGKSRSAKKRKAVLANLQAAWKVGKIGDKIVKNREEWFNTKSERVKAKLDRELEELYADRKD